MKKSLNDIINEGAERFDQRPLYRASHAAREELQEAEISVTDKIFDMVVEEIRETHLCFEDSSGKYAEGWQDACEMLEHDIRKLQYDVKMSNEKG